MMCWKTKFPRRLLRFTQNWWQDNNSIHTPFDHLAVRKSKFVMFYPLKLMKKKNNWSLPLGSVYTIHLTENIMITNIWSLSEEKNKQINQTWLKENKFILNQIITEIGVDWILRSKRMPIKKHMRGKSYVF